MTESDKSDSESVSDPKSEGTEIDGIPEDEHAEGLKDYNRRCEELTKLSMRLPAVLAAASGFPLYTDLGSQTSRQLFTWGLAISGLTVLLEYVRQHANLRHVEQILTEPEKYDDFHHAHTKWGKFGDILFWFRGGSMLIAGVLIVIGMAVFRAYT